uniref:Ubiquitin-like domain-containing protein n=1 Tax=Ailuropoda melanoleuca TaxID=9646 RepID=A0A7N5K4Z9_AILME
MSVTGTPAVVSVSISSSLNSFRTLKRYARGLTIAEFKCKLELVVGSPASCMELELYTPDDKFVMKLDRDEALLGSYPVDEGCRIHVIDHSGATIGEYEDVSKVEKFQIADSEYDKRADTARSFMKRSHLGQYNKEEMLKKESELEQKLVEEKALAEAISLGARCEVRGSRAGRRKRGGSPGPLLAGRNPPRLPLFPQCTDPEWEGPLE